ESAVVLLAHILHDEGLNSRRLDTSGDELGTEGSLTNLFAHLDPSFTLGSLDPGPAGLDIRRPSDGNRVRPHGRGKIGCSQVGSEPGLAPGGARCRVRPRSPRQCYLPAGTLSAPDTTLCSASTDPRSASEMNVQVRPAPLSIW